MIKSSSSEGKLEVVECKTEGKTSGVDGGSKIVGAMEGSTETVVEMWDWSEAGRSLEIA